jgi:hypothetical protein
MTCIADNDISWDDSFTVSQDGFTLRCVMPRLIMGLFTTRLCSFKYRFRPRMKGSLKIRGNDSARKHMFVKCKYSSSNS